MLELECFSAVLVLELECFSAVLVLELECFSAVLVLELECFSAVLSRTGVTTGDGLGSRFGVTLLEVGGHVEVL